MQDTFFWVVCGILTLMTGTIFFLTINNYRRIATLEKNTGFQYNILVKIQNKKQICNQRGCRTRRNDLPRPFTKPDSCSGGIGYNATKHERTSIVANTGRIN